MKAVIYKRINDISLKEWEKLWKHSPYANYANSPYWLLSVLEAFDYKEYVIIAIYKGESLVSIGALIQEKRYGVSIYTPVPTDLVCGMPFLLDPNDEVSYRLLIKQLKKLHAVFLENIPSDFIKGIRTFSPESIIFPQAPNYLLQLTRDEKGLPVVPNRKQLLRKVRGIEEEFTMQSFTGSTKKGLEYAFAIDKKSQKQNKGYSTFSDPKAKAFFIILAKHFRKHFKANILFFNDAPIAYELGFTANKTYFGSQIAYDAAYMQYVPGKILVARLIELLHAENIKVMDLGSGEGSVKRLITKENRQLYQVIISASPFLRIYIKSFSQSKNYLFDQINQHKRLYLAYRKVRAILPL